MMKSSTMPLGLVALACAAIAASAFRVGPSASFTRSFAASSFPACLWHRKQQQLRQHEWQPRQQRRRSSMLTTRMVFERFSGDAVAAVMFAQQESKRMPGNELEPVHLFLGVASSPEGTYGALQRCKLSSLSDISQAVEEFCFARAAEEEANAAAAEAAKDSSPMGGLPAGLPNFFGAGAGNNGGANPASPASNDNGKKEKKKGGGGGDAPFSRKSQRTFPRALELAENFGSDVVRSEHLLLAVLEDESVAAVLDDFGVATDDLTAEVCADMESGRGNAELVGAGPPRGKTPTLSECGVDLTEQAREGLLDPVAGRDDETARALQILVRRRKSNPCFIGEPGVGKTAIAEAIAARIASGVSAFGVFGDRLILFLLLLFRWSWEEVEEKRIAGAPSWIGRLVPVAPFILFFVQ